jgi:hypothetical protein
VNTLIAYFSVSGHTQAVATVLAAALGAELERIEPAGQIPRNRLALLFLGGFAASTRRAWAVKPAARGPAGHDLIIVGTPVWSWTLNPVVRGWLKANPIPAPTPYAAFATAGGPVGSRVFDEMTTLLGRAPVATMGISDADRTSGADARLIERFVADVRASRVAA